MPDRLYKEWQAGAALFAIGNILNFISFGERGLTKMYEEFLTLSGIVRRGCACAGFAAQSLLAALGSIQFVTNVIFAKYLLHERVRSAYAC